MALYDDLKEAIEGKHYTILEARNILNSFTATLQITTEQYEELFELTNSLSPNTSDDETSIWKKQMETRVSTLEQSYKALKEAVEKGSTTVTEPTTQAGTAEDPITAARGMHYEQGKYYKDPEKNNEVYICTETIDLNGMPHEYVNIYFNWHSIS